MCTVTRPGLAPIASATAVELLVSLLQHPLGWVPLGLRRLYFGIFIATFCSLRAPAPPPGQGPQQPQREGEGSVLGLVPHQLRGFLAQFRNMPIVGAAYDRCTGCSETVRRAVLTMSGMADLMMNFFWWLQVLRAYETKGFAMLLKAFNESGFLESLTGLDKLHAEGEQALEAVDWEEEGEGTDEDF